MDCKMSLEQRFGDCKNLTIDHIGSTSIHTIPFSKPSIDILMGVENAPDFYLISDDLATKGFREKSDVESFEMPGHNYFQIYNNLHEITNVIHVLPQMHPLYEEFLLFKRYMLEHPECAKLYAAEKLKLVKSGLSRPDYQIGKGEFYGKIQAKARRLYVYDKDVLTPPQTIGQPLRA